MIQIKVGTKLRCVNNTNKGGTFTVGKIYTVSMYRGGEYFELHGDNGSRTVQRIKGHKAFQPHWETFEVVQDRPLILLPKS